MNRSTLSLLPALLTLALVACGGDDSTNSDGGNSDTTTAASSGMLDEVTAAIEATGYTCTPESFSMTSAAHEVCNTTTSIGVQAYAWADAATLTAEIETEIMCSADSTLGSIMSLRGDTWAISAFSLSASTAEKQTEINAVLASFQNTLGGEILDKPCA